MTGQTSVCWGVVPAAGSGSRMGGDIPKQYLLLQGKTVLEHSVSALLGCQAIAQVVVALDPADTRAQQLTLLQQERVALVAGGATRTDSVLAALRALVSYADPDDWVLVHDAARPCIRPEAIETLIAQVQQSGCGAILAQPMVDTVKRADSHGRVDVTLDRSLLWRAQTPQIFRLGQLLEALDAAHASGTAVTDEASAMELAGYPVQLVAGPNTNLKITVAADLALADFYLQAGADGR